MKIKITITTLAALALLLAAGAWAQQAKKYSLVDTVTITRVDWEAGQILATDFEGKAVDVTVDGDTRIMLGAETVSPAKLGPGDRVVIEARKELEGKYEADQLVADRLLIVVDPSRNESSSGTTLGRVASTDAAAGTLTVETGAEAGPVAFRVEPEDVSIHDAPASLAEVEMGDRVAVDHDGEIQAGATPTKASSVRVDRATIPPAPRDSAGEPVLRQDP